MGYFAPIVAFGKTDSKTATAAVSAGDTEIEVDNSGSDYAVGDDLFISKSDDTELEYLGQLTAVASDSVTVEVAVAADKGASAKLWKPNTSFRFSSGPGFGVRFVDRLGTFIDVSRGGQVTSTQIADAVRELEFEWGKGALADYQGFRSFLLGERSSGSKSFSFGYWDHSLEETRVDEIRFRGIAAGGEEGLRSSTLTGDVKDEKQIEYSMNAFIENADTYVAS